MRMSMGVCASADSTPHTKRAALVRPMLINFHRHLKLHEKYFCSRWKVVWICWRPSFDPGRVGLRLLAAEASGASLCCNRHTEAFHTREHFEVTRQRVRLGDW